MLNFAGQTIIITGATGITEAVSEEHKADGVTANCVMPGAMKTAANHAAMPDADQSSWVAPESVAALVAFLLSADASAVTGAAIPATGTA